MMRLYIIFLLMPLLSQAQELTVIDTIKFSSITRGFSEVITITKNSIAIAKQDRSTNLTTKTFPITAGEWQDVLQSLENVDLKNMAHLESPTKARAYDGAKHSCIALSHNNSKEQHTFDDDNPHQNLKPLMLAIRRLEHQHTFSK